MLQSCLPSSLDHRNDNSQSIFGWIWNFWQQWLTHCQSPRHGPFPSCIRCSWTHLATVRCIGRNLSIYRQTLQTKIRQQIPNNDKDMWICKQFKLYYCMNMNLWKRFQKVIFIFKVYVLLYYNIHMEFQGKAETFPRLIELINRQFLKNCYPYKIAQQECHKPFKFIM